MNHFDLQSILMIFSFVSQLRMFTEIFQSIHARVCWFDRKREGYFLQKSKFVCFNVSYSAQTPYFQSFSLKSISDWHHPFYRLKKIPSHVHVCSNLYCDHFFSPISLYTYSTPTSLYEYARVSLYARVICHCHYRWSTIKPHPKWLSLNGFRCICANDENKMRLRCSNKM